MVQQVDFLLQLPNEIIFVLVGFQQPGVLLTLSGQLLKMHTDCTHSYMKGKYFHKETVRGICIEVYQEICPLISLATQDLEFHTSKQLPWSIAV